MSGSTWDVSVDNMAQKDIEHFRTSYPALKSVAIQTFALPPFDRAAAQRLWEGDTPEPKKVAEAVQPAVQVATK
jgi:hypothetical protein